MIRIDGCPFLLRVANWPRFDANTDDDGTLVALSDEKGVSFRLRHDF